MKKTKLCKLDFYLRNLNQRFPTQALNKSENFGPSDLLVDLVLPLYYFSRHMTHLSPCYSMVRISHCSSESYRLYIYVTFTLHLSPCSSIVRASHWLSEGYRLYTYVTFTLPS